MKFKINAGAEIDVLTKGELQDALSQSMTSWFYEVAKGDRYRRFSTFADADDSGVILIGERPFPIGPEQGFVWAVKRLAITNYDPSEENISLGLFVNSDNSSATVHPDLEVYNSFDSNQLVLYPGDQLLISGTVAANAKVWVTGQARELPISLAWRL